MAIPTNNLGAMPLLVDATPSRIMAYDNNGETIDVAKFLGDVGRVIPKLKDQSYVVNTCKNRYNFLVCFAAALCAKQTTLLPHSGARVAIDRILDSYPGSYLLSDTITDEHPYPDVLLNCQDFFRGEQLLGSIPLPEINATQTAAILFTSGSTGEPQANEISWFKLCYSAQQLDKKLSKASAANHPVIATVPPQHMYGLETSVMLPLQSSRAVFSGSSFYPEDIKFALHKFPTTAILVTTPVHLQVLSKAKKQYPSAALVLSATAPLQLSLARESETQLGCEVHEIYGSSETGAIAMRRTISGNAWHLMSGVAIEPTANGVAVKSKGLTAAVYLKDRIECCDNNRFILHGRGEDIIKIAGKRQSLAYIGSLIKSIEGVEDAVVFLSPVVGGGKSQLVTRLTALVVAPGKHIDELSAELRLAVDSVFIPRPIFCVEKLPRNSVGKLPADALENMWQQLNGSNC